MIRHPRTARASMPGYRAKMTPRYTFRLFVISMMIVATIVESPVSAFSIRSRPRKHAELDEYITDASSVQIKSAPTTADIFKIVDAARDRTSSTSAKVFEIKGEPSKIEDKVELTTAFILLKTDDGYLKITGLPIYTSSIKETDPISPLVTTKLPDSTKSLKEDSVVEENDTTVDSDSSSTSMTYSQMSASELTTHLASMQPTITAASLDTTKTDDNTSSETKVTEKNNLTRNNSIGTTTSHDETTTGTTATSSRSTLRSKQTSIEQNAENITATPTGKKYIMIDRKRSGPSGLMSASSSEPDAETSPTRVSLEKLLTDTSISSLGQLGINLSPKTTYAFDISSTPPIIQETISLLPDVSTQTTSTKQASPRTLQITSKRAGFLDFSAKPFAEEATTIIESYDIPDKSNETRGFSSMFEFEPENELETKNSSGVASQSRLAEDVMREEMMKEEMMSNENVNSKRMKESDQLSVKPIDKTTLYSVGPNYKPMKKLDVQPAKQFLRNPDDLSWRNESISSLGIVFKAKPASKNFTEVLKNKTETLLTTAYSNGSDKDSKNDIPDLRERLEKIGEVRKSKKKKVIDKFGETIYTDYEENSNSAETSTTPATTLSTKMTESLEPLTEEPDATTQISVKHIFQSFKDPETEFTKLPKKFNADYYDVTDEYDNDYMNFPKIDLKKFTTRLPVKDTTRTTLPAATAPFQKPSTQYWPDRKPTLQYFPPRPTTGQKPTANIHGYDENPINKLNYYTFKETTKNLIPVAVRFTTLPAQAAPPLLQQHPLQLPAPLNLPKYKNDLSKTAYYTQPRGPPAPRQPVDGSDDGRYVRPTYVIKHFKDLIEKASHDTDDDRDADYEDGGYSQTQSPPHPTVSDLTKTTQKVGVPDEYDYDAGYRKDVLNRFVDNFNQNSERFKVDFPILYNNSVVHRKQEASGAERATSSAFLKRLYEARGGGACDGCERHVELPPEYELHYYVPEQEEQEEAAPSSRLYSVWGGRTPRERR